MKSIRFSKFAFIILVAAQLVLGVQAPQPAIEIGGAYLTHISTDKPIYRTGEKLYVRSVVLRAEGHTPMTSAGTASFQIKGPKGDIVASGTSPINDSVSGFAWEIPASQAGGEYTIRISHPWSDAPAERKFDIRAYRAPRLKSQIVFVRDGYGPGDTVGARLHVERAEGGIPAGAKVSVSARVDGEETWKGEAKVDASGNAEANFKLPRAITRGEGVLAMVIQDGGTVETAAKTIPILLQTVDLAIYPEGGDLVAGLTNRVYIEGRTPAQKPADMAGVIVNAAGKEVATFRTEHEGRGRFSFVPANGEKYSLRLNEPAGITKLFPLPTVKESGVVIHAVSNVTPRLEDVVVRVAATTKGTYGVALTQRGKELSFKRVILGSNQATEVTFTVPKSLDGVMAATVYDERKTPLAERLLFRQPERILNVSVVADQSDYVPGDKVTLRVTTTDETGKPVGATVGLAVTDSSVLEMIDKREQAPRLPVMVLFENEVRNLSDAHVYLDETNPKAPLATDLLLGTQGWRRFATIDTTKFLAAHGDAARRALAIRTIAPQFGGPQPVPFTGGVFRQPASRVPAYFVGSAAAGNEFIAGSVMDMSNALIPGVLVQAVNLATNVVVSAITNESGAYTLPRVAPGTYQVTASLPGFQTSRVVGLPLSPNTSVRQDFPLQISSTSTMVEVSISANELLTTSSASVGQVLPQQQIRDLPLVGNNVLELIPLMQGIGTVRDGISVVNSRTVINPDLVGEIRLILTPVDVELGRGNATIANGGGRPVGSTMTVREYAHALTPNRNEGARADFSETVYWNAAVKTDAATGKASVSFDLSDSVTSFRVSADGFTSEGMLGSSTNHIESVKPFFIEPKVPLQVTSGDVIQLPVGIVNGMNRELRGTELNATGAAGLKITRPGDNPSTLRPKERTRNIVQLEVANNFSGSANLTLDARAGRYRDTVSRQLDIQPMGFPHETSTGGVLESNGSRSFEFALPQEFVRGSISSNATVYPTPLASMTDALRALIREPYGCFEQTSSTSYPMVMAQQYFLTHTGVDPALIEKTRGLLDSAYKRLLGFQSRTGGFEWFGGNPGHEGLTAYGLMQFTDMAKVRSVDKDMLANTRAWLLTRRDGKGGFSVNRNASNSFSNSSAATTNAYIVWALIESGEKGLDKEIAALKAAANSAQDSYVVALVANILHATGDPSGARQLMDKLAKSQDTAGNVKGAVGSITYSGGEALAIETTALSVLAWMREPSYTANTDKGMKWIVEANRNGRFGSTQSTILALRSIVAHDAAYARPKAPGRILLTVDGKTVGSPLAFDANTQGALVLPEITNELGPGKHTIALRMEDGSRMPYSISVKYHSTLPDSSESTQVGIQVALKDSQVREGEVTEATASIVNKSNHPIPTPVAIVGIPGGLEVRHDQLKELVKSGRIDAYEVIGREVIFYWRFLRANERFDLPLSLVAAVPGAYTGPASRAYLYYTDEFKNWAPGLKVNITPR
jgi:hypothetical protein